MFRCRRGTVRWERDLQRVLSQPIVVRMWHVCSSFVRSVRAAGRLFHTAISRRWGPSALHTAGPTRVDHGHAQAPQWEAPGGNVRECKGLGRGWE